MTESRLALVAVLLSFLLFALPFSGLPEVKAQESTIQKIARPISMVGDIVIRVAERLFAMPVDLMGYVTGLTIGFMERYSYNMVTRTALSIVLELIGVALLIPAIVVLFIFLFALSVFVFALCLLVTAVFVLSFPFLLVIVMISIVLYVLSSFLMVVTFMFVLPLLVLFPIWLVSLIVMVGIILYLIWISPFVLLLFCVVDLISLLLFPLSFIIPVIAGLVLAALWTVVVLMYESSGFRPAFRTFSSPLYSCLSLMNGIAARFSVVALLWSEFYDGLLRGSSISPFVRNFFQIAARGFYLEKTPLV